MNRLEMVQKVLDANGGMTTVEHLREQMPKPDPNETVRAARAANVLLEYLDDNGGDIEDINRVWKLRGQLEDEARDDLIERFRVEKTEMGIDLPGMATITDPVSRLSVSALMDNRKVGDIRPLYEDKLAMDVLAP